MKTFFTFFMLISSLAFSQTGNVSIEVYDDFTKHSISATARALPLDTIFVGKGKIELTALPVGVYTIEISAEGYQTQTLKEVEILPQQNLRFSLGLNSQKQNEIKEITLTKKIYKTNIESPVSYRNITSEEVQKNAGANRDVSKALLSLPGVGSTATFRNELFIRGGSAAENRFYVDGIEVPVINHFQTQGSSGGPKGLLTIDFIKDVDFFSGAFPAKRGGVMSSLFEFNLKQARKDRVGYKGVLGLDDIQMMIDGPLSKDQSWGGLFSVRKSNLQLLFKGLGLPFLPSYYDITTKVSKKYASGSELYFLFLGGLDNFKFNEKAKETLENATLIERLPVISQWNYTLGVGYRHLVENGNWLFIWSRNQMSNQIEKYYQNISTPENLLTNYRSTEEENKIRIERNFLWGKAKISYGANVNTAYYRNLSFLKLAGLNATDDYKTTLTNTQYGAFLQATHQFWNGKLALSAGVRIDGNDYSSLMNNPLKQFSPRFSAKYQFAERFAFNFNTGIYYMLPSYTALGFGQNENFVNRNSLKYMKNTHFVGGLEYQAPHHLRLTIEGYYKKYNDYPFSLRNKISLANLGADFGFIGAEPLDSRSTGKTYGVEFLAQKRTLNNFYGIVAYTFGISQFGDAEGKMLPSSWDSRHIFTLTAGKYLKRNWNIGARFRLQSGLPQTPYDLEKSPLVQVWNIANAPIYDYSKLNSERGNLVHQLDIRVEKQWIFKKWKLSLYADIVNAYGSKNPSRLPVVALNRDASGRGIILNPSAPSSSQLYSLQYEEPQRITPLPYLGIIFDF